MTISLPLERDRSSSTRSSEGTQAISRSILILRLIARRGVEGSRLTDLTRASGIPHPTLRRILLCLIEEGLVIQDSGSRRYQLGPLNYELGLATVHRNDFHGKLKPRLERLARLSGDTVYLNIRSRSEQVCLDRIEGSSVIRAVTQDIGGRRPLSLGSSGIAILANLTDDEIEDVIRGNAQDIYNHPRITVESIWRAIAKTRANGYALIRDTTVVGVSAIGILLPAASYQPTVAVSLAMVNDRLTSARASELGRLMKRELENETETSFVD
jgi:DNA-binding IclR family transcriptional regulator